MKRSELLFYPIHNRYILGVTLLCIACLCGCSPSKTVAKQATLEISEIRFLGQYDLKKNISFKDTKVGGLSGIDYDAKRNIYYLISDDRSDNNPVRYYSARVHARETGIDSVEFFEVITILGPDGKPYPNSAQDPNRVPDPESIRYDVLKNQLIWTSEGERDGGKNVFIDPVINYITPEGNHSDTFSISSNLRMNSKERGPRRNGTFEGMTFADNFSTLYVSMEEPIYEDGPRAATGDSSAWVRIVKYNTTTKKQIAQFAYRVEPVAKKPTPAGDFKINGISEILSVGDDKLLVIERSYSVGHPSNTIQVFLADLKDATDIAGVRSLNAAPSEKPVSKKLLYHFNYLNRHIDNIEGVSFGPTLRNGHQTLIFVTDDNFNPSQTTQFFLFEIIPGN